MLNGWIYKWIDVTDWEFARINSETRALASQGWELDAVLEDPATDASGNTTSQNRLPQFRSLA